MPNPVEVGQIRLSGLLLGRHPSDSPYVITGASGLVGIPEVRSFDTDRSSGDGGRAGRDRYATRTIEVGVAVVGDTPDDAYGRLSDLAAAMSRIDTFDLAELVWHLPGQTSRWARVRPRRWATPETDNLDADVVEARIQLEALDPSMMDVDERSVTATIADGATQAQVTAHQGGNGRAWPTVTVAGPARNPRITNSTVGRALRVDVDVPGGSELLVDVRRRRVSLDGVPQFETVRADHQWWQLAPGPNVLVASRSSVALTGASATVEVAWHDSYDG